MAPARARLAWGTLGLVAAASMYWVYTIPGAIGLMLSIAAAFLLWYRVTPSGSWLALVTMGVAMAIVLGTQAATSSRCPDPGKTVILKEGKPPVSCDEIRASSTSMAVFFGLVALVGVGIGARGRRLDAQEADLDAPGEEPAGT